MMPFHLSNSTPARPFGTTDAFGSPAPTTVGSERAGSASDVRCSDPKAREEDACGEQDAAGRSTVILLTGC
jgi:hypothetical protein